MTSETGSSHMRVQISLRSFSAEVDLPPGTEILRSPEPEALADVRAAVDRALAAPIESPPLAELCRAAITRTAPREPKVVVVVSDSTRPVPYRGESGILRPLLDAIFSTGIVPGSVTLLVATGTHRKLSEDEIWALFDQEVRQSGVQALCHDAGDLDTLVPVGKTAGGGDVLMNRVYVEADLRILTGLVEPHLMAGVSGGRKSLCPGLLNVQGVQDFHSPRVLADPRSTDLLLEGNPCHEISLKIARMAPADFILNATMGQYGKVAGVFAGDMERAHLAAADHMKSFVEIPIVRLYDVVVAHGGHVGVNHYQAEKAAAVAAKALRPGGYVVVVADTTDPDPVGSQSYRRLIRMLTELGPEAFVEKLTAEDWQFAQDQWGAQVWAQLLSKVPRDHVYYFSPQTATADYPLLMCTFPPHLAELAEGCAAGESASSFVTTAVAEACKRSKTETGYEAAVAYLQDGPHGIPVLRPQ
jgi:nickel-dependent lactate racemase